jgi:hypothetical protein
VCLEIWIARFCVRGAKHPKGSQRQTKDLAKTVRADSVNEGF